MIPLRLNPVSSRSSSHDKVSALTKLCTDSENQILCSFNHKYLPLDFINYVMLQQLNEFILLLFSLFLSLVFFNICVKNQDISLSM
uniref:Uncharacterized protein n=1 Tax=Rhizophora mucronata TaxID=61149 RepID=A0A2P2PSB1_RHIMU